MPKINPNEYQDWEDDRELEILEDEPVDRMGRRVQPRAHPTLQDQDWLENRKRLQQMRSRREPD